MSSAEARRRIDLVVVGASLGGLYAVPELIGALPDDYEPSVVVVQHRRGDGDSTLARLLSSRCHRPVREPEHGDPIRARHTYLAPAGYHLLIEPATFALSTEGPVAYARPSIDVTLESAAYSYGDRVAAILLTGANADGAAGSRAVARAGGLVLVQDPRDAEAPEMPSAALAAVPGVRPTPLAELASVLVTRCGENR